MTMIEINVTILNLSQDQIDTRLAELSDVLIDCVEGGASVSFMWPMTRAKADAFWRGVRDDVAAGTTALFAAEQDGRIAGTILLANAWPENQPHRADIGKMLVHRAARRRGLARALMVAAEAHALTIGRTVLVLDTASAEAGALYRSMGWQEVGRVPDYALMPDGALCDTIFYTKKLA